MPPATIAGHILEKSENKISKKRPAGLVLARSKLTSAAASLSGSPKHLHAKAEDYDSICVIL
jgi:hypothetical protein